MENGRKGSSWDVVAAGSGRFAQVDHVAQTGSTNDDLLAVVPSDPETARALIADEQLSGRGRRNRAWQMPAGGGLLISFFVPWKASETAHMIPTCLGVAAVEASAAFGRLVQLKWPNDLVDSNDAKVGGMLSSAAMSDGKLIGVVAGLGCNVSWPPSSVSELPNATCLDRLGPDPVDRVDFAAALVTAYHGLLNELETRGAASVHERYRSSCRTIGQVVRVERSAGDLVGRATDIDPSGALLLEVDGIQHRIDVGDVMHLRPQS